MRVTITCDSCGARTEGERIPDRFRCKVCRQTTVFVQTQTPRRERKVPFSPGWRFMAQVVSDPQRGLLLACDRPAVFRKFVLEDGRWTAGELTHLRVSFEVIRQRSDQALVVRVVGSPPGSRAVAAPAFVIPAERRMVKHDVELEFPPPGQSELERLVATRGDVITRISDLASRKDDPVAWWTLALGHRSKQIRIPVEANLRAVGIERIDRMLRQAYVFDWDPDLLDFVDEEMRKPKDRGGRGVTLPGDRPGWDKPWWADD